MHVVERFTLLCACVLCDLVTVTWLMKVTIRSTLSRWRPSQRPSSDHRHRHRSCQLASRAPVHPQGQAGCWPRLSVDVQPSPVNRLRRAGSSRRSRARSIFVGTASQRPPPSGNVPSRLHPTNASGRQPDMTSQTTPEVTSSRAANRRNAADSAAFGKLVTALKPLCTNTAGLE